MHGGDLERGAGTRARRRPKSWSRGPERAGARGVGSGSGTRRRRTARPGAGILGAGPAGGGGRGADLTACEEALPGPAALMEGLGNLQLAARWGGFLCVPFPFILR